MKKERVSSGSFFLVSRFFFALKKISFFVSSSVRWLKKKATPSLFGVSLAVRTPVRSDVSIWCSASLLIKKVKEKEKENRRRFSFYLKEQLGSVHLVSIFVLFKVQIKCVCVCVFSMDTLGRPRH